MKFFALFMSLFCSQSWALSADMELLYKARTQENDLRSIVQSLSVLQSQEKEQGKLTSDRANKLKGIIQQCQAVQGSLDIMKEALRQTIEFREAEKLKGKLECGSLVKVIEDDVKYDGAVYLNLSRTDEAQDDKWKSGVKRTLETADFCRKQAATVLPASALQTTHDDGAAAK